MPRKWKNCIKKIFKKIKILDNFLKKLKDLKKGFKNILKNNQTISQYWKHCVNDRKVALKLNRNQNYSVKIKKKNPTQLKREKEVKNLKKNSQN